MKSRFLKRPLDDDSTVRGKFALVGRRVFRPTHRPLPSGRLHVTSRTCLAASQVCTSVPLRISFLEMSSPFCDFGVSPLMPTTILNKQRKKKTAPTLFLVLPPTPPKHQSPLHAPWCIPSAPVHGEPPLRWPVASSPNSWAFGQMLVLLQDQWLGFHCDRKSSWGPGLFTDLLESGAWGAQGTTGLSPHQARMSANTSPTRASVLEPGIIGPTLLLPISSPTKEDKGPVSPGPPAI